MNGTRKPGPVNLTERPLHLDRRARRRLGRAQSVGRVLLFALVLLGGAGLLGGRGPFASQVVPLQGPAELRLPRFVRYQAPFDVELVLLQPVQGPVQVRLSSGMAQDLSIERAWPEPVSSRWSVDGLELVFAPGTERMVLRAQPVQVGDLGGHVSLHRDDPTRVPLWSHP